MPREKIFLSAVSSQFKVCRDALASDLRAIGCEVCVQEDFQQGPRTLIERLEEYIASCDRVIALVGDVNGAEAKAEGLLGSKPPRSYTQWEYYFALGERLRGNPSGAKDLYVYTASDEYLREHTVTEPAEHTRRQREHVDFILRSGKHRASFDRLDQLCRLVLRDGWQLLDRPVQSRPAFQLPSRALARQFFGRQLLLADLTARLKRREHVDVWGPAGMGKTALAAEAIYQVVGGDNAQLGAGLYPDGIVLLDLYRLKFTSPDPSWSYLADAFDASVSATLPPRERAVRACKGRRALVIVEGAEEAGSGTVLQDLLSVLAPETTRVVLTRDKRQTSTAQPISLIGELARDEALALLRELAPEVEQAIIEGVHERLCGHPLALTWAGSQIAAVHAEESPHSFLAALRAEKLPKLNEPGYETHTLQWLYGRSVTCLGAEARNVLSGAGMLAQQPFPLSAALAILRAAEQGCDEPNTQEALKQLVRYGLLRASSGEMEQWQFTHALAHQFAAANVDLKVLFALGDWAVADFDAAVAQVRATDDFAALAHNLNHDVALLRLDHNTQVLAALSRKLRYDGYETLAAFGRLDLVTTAANADHAWLQSARRNKKAASDWEYDLCASYSTLGDIAALMGNLAAARQAFEKSLALCEPLAKVDASNGHWQRTLSINYNRLGDVYKAVGQLQSARQAFENSLAIASHLAQANPHNSLWLSDLTFCYMKLGDLYMTAGQLTLAREVFEKSLTIAQHLSQVDLSNSKWQRDLAIGYEKLGDVGVATGQLESARQAFEKSMTIFEGLALGDSSNSHWQRDLSFGYEKLGDVYMANRQFDSAHQAFEKSLAIRQRLAQADPSNSQRQRDLSFSHNRLGEVYISAGQLTSARHAFDKSLIIRERMVQADPNNSVWQRDLFVSYVKLAEIDEHYGENTNGLVWAKKGLAISEHLTELDPLNAQWKNDLTSVHAMMERLRGAE